MVVERLLKELRVEKVREHQKSRGIHKERLLCRVSMLGTTQSRKLKAHVTNRLWAQEWISFLALTIGAICGNLLHSHGSIKTCTGECLRVNQGVMMKLVLGGLCEDLRGGKGGRRGAKIESIRRKSGPSLGRGHIKPIGQCRVLQGTGNLTKETNNLSGYINWWEIRS